MKKSTFFAGLLASLLLVGCSKGEEPSSSAKPSTETSSSQTSSSETSSSQSSSSESSSSESSSSSSTVVTVPAESVTLAGEAEVEVGKTLTLTATVAPETTTDKTVVWTSSDENKATVVNGVVTGVAAGTVTIKATCGEKFAEKEIEVKPAAILPTELEITNGWGGYFVEGTELQLETKFTPAEPTNKGITWSSTKPENVSVDENGKIKVLKAFDGYCYVNAVSIADNEVKDGFKVFPTKVPEAISITDGTDVVDDKTVFIGKTFAFGIKYSSNYDAEGVTWTSSNTEVATVNEDGVVTGITKGTTTLTAKSKFGEITDTCTITVDNEQALVIPAEGFTFNLGTNITEKEVADLGSNGNNGTKIENKTLTSGDAIITLSECTNAYYGVYDKKGENCIRIGSNKNAGILNMTVQNEVTSVTIKVARYNTDKATDIKFKITVGGVELTDLPELTNSSADSTYHEIVIPTVDSKDIVISTAKKRVMISEIILK